MQNQAEIKSLKSRKKKTKSESHEIVVKVIY